MLENTGYKKYHYLVQVRRFSDGQEELTGERKPNNYNDPDYLDPVLDYDTCPLTTTGWRGQESTAYCVKDNYNQNTGNKAYSLLEEYRLDDGSLTGNVKPNTFGDPNYISPFPDSFSCPVQRFTAWRARESSAFCVQTPEPVPESSISMVWDAGVTTCYINIIKDGSVVLTLNKNETSGYFLSKTLPPGITVPYDVEYNIVGANLAKTFIHLTINIITPAPHVSSGIGSLTGIATVQDVNRYVNVATLLLP